MRTYLVLPLTLLAACSEGSGGNDSGVAPEFADITATSIASARIERTRIGGGLVGRTNQTSVDLPADPNAALKREGASCPLDAGQTASLLDLLRHATPLSEQPSSLGADATITFQKRDGGTIIAVIGDENVAYAPETPIFFATKGATLSPAQRKSLGEIAAAAGCSLQ